MFTIRFASPLCLLLVASLAAADPPAHPGASPGKADAKTDTKSEDIKEHLVETSHSITIGGSKIDYKAIAGTLVLKNDENKPTAAMFIVAYTKTGLKNASERPITFAFNGGPGSSAVWLHLGCLGPRRVVVSDTNVHNTPPYQMVDNDTSLLDVSDLVFIDPVSTGFSRASSKEEAKKYHGVMGDLQSVGQLIHLYLTRYERWESPKYLIGESYGTTRGAALASHLQREHGIYVDGVSLLSPALNFQTILAREGNDLPYILFLPGFTATAWYHHKLSQDLQGDFQKTIEQARDFARNDYALLLFKGDTLSAEQRRQAAQRVAHFTGLSEEFVLRKNLRVAPADFMEELLRKEQQVVGRFDSRITRPKLEEGSDQLNGDPSYTAVQGAFTAAFNQYVRTDLNYQSDLPYEILNIRIQPWDWTPAINGYLYVSDDLRHALVSSPDLHVFVGTGYYDLATPFLSTEYTISHLGLPGVLARQVSIHYYDAGHMMYTHPPSREKLKKDLAGFYHSSLPKASTSH